MQLLMLINIDLHLLKLQLLTAPMQILLLRELLEVRDWLGLMVLEIYKVISATPQNNEEDDIQNNAAKQAEMQMDLAQSTKSKGMKLNNQDQRKSKKDKKKNCAC